MSFRLEDVIDLNKTDPDNLHYTFKVYISKDPETKVFKVSICGLQKEDRIVIYGTKEVVNAKLKDLISYIAHAINEINNPFL
jgi:hypothetical protein